MTCNITDELQPKAERSKNIEETAAVLKLLGDKTRLTMLKYCNKKIYAFVNSLKFSTSVNLLSAGIYEN